MREELPHAGPWGCWHSPRQSRRKERTTPAQDGAGRLMHPCRTGLTQQHSSIPQAATPDSALVPPSSLSLTTGSTVQDQAASPQALSHVG